MTQPTERDREMAMEVFRHLCGAETFALPAVAQAIAAAREEGRREERARCAAIARLPEFTWDSPQWAGWETPEIAPAIADAIEQEDEDENATVSDLSDETKGIPSPTHPKNDQG